MTQTQYSNIAVIGCGPAGLMAATVAAEAGASVVVVETKQWAGGRLALQTQPLQGPRTIYSGLSGVDFCRRLQERALAAGVDLILSTSVSDLRPGAREPGFELTCVGSGAPVTRVATSVILATGSWEPAFDFPGVDLHGVMLSGDAQEMLNVHGKLPGRRVLMVGSDNAGLLISANLRDAGAEVVAVVDESNRVEGREFNAGPLHRAGVELLTCTRVVKAMGGGRVTNVSVAEINPKGEIVAGGSRSFEVDTVCLAGPRTAESRLAAQLGVPLQHEDIMGGSVPVHGKDMATNVPGLLVCGDASGVESGATALETGRLAGLAASERLGYSHPKASRYRRLARARIGYLRRGRRGAVRRKAEQSLIAAHRKIGLGMGL